MINPLANDADCLGNFVGNAKDQRLARAMAAVAQAGRRAAEREEATTLKHVLRKEAE